MTTMFNTYQERLEKELRGVMTNSQITSLHEPLSYFFSLPAKRVRPLITLITAEHFFKSFEAAVDPAIAIEVLHHFTLVHDDIMDGDHLRRGRETVHHKWDTGTALLSGDAMLSLAYEKLLSSKSPYLLDMLRTFTHVLQVMCEGQARDKDFETRDDVSLQDYLDMSQKKTARLLSLAFELGYLSCSYDAFVLEALRSMGKHMGTAFQVRDDLLDFVANEKTLGKDVGSDWRRRKKTYITIDYHQRAKKNDHLPQDLFAAKKFSAARQAVIKAGVTEDAQEFINRQLQEARYIAEDLDFSHPGLDYFFQFLASRNY